MRPRGRPVRRSRVDDQTTETTLVDEEQYVPPRRPPLPEIWPWSLLLLVLVVGGVLAAYFLTRDDDKKSSGATATVPAVVGVKQDEAVGRLDERGLVPNLISRRSKFPSGTVFAQAPGAGTQADRGSRVSLSVSAAAVTRIPNVVGLRAAQAVARLKAGSLRSRVTSVTAKAAQGVVSAESPAQGTNVAKGSTVVLRSRRVKPPFPMSSGSRSPRRRRRSLWPVWCPHGLRRRNDHRPDNDDLAAETVKVPDVVGLQQAPAQRRLRSAGLGARVKYVASQQPSGTVVAESPAAGTPVRTGSKVTISVSLGPNSTTAQVPNVVGQDQQTATSTLQAQGFQVQVITVPPQDPSQSGMVVDKQPVGGTRAPQGSTVTIYVGSSG